MSISLRIDVEDAGLGERLQTFMDGLTDRTEIHEAIGIKAMEFTKAYLLARAPGSHKTAERLGGTPTDFLGKAARQTSYSATNESAVVTIRNPGIGRADHPVTIEPTEGREWLTLPMRGLAYGRTVSQVQDLLGKRLFRPLKKGAKATGHKIGGRHTATFDDSDKMKALGVSDGNGGMDLYFALAKSVTQKQDREMLPSDEDYGDIALAGVRTWWKSTVSEAAQ